MKRKKEMTNVGCWTPSNRCKFGHNIWCFVGGDAVALAGYVIASCPIVIQTKKNEWIAVDTFLRLH